MWNKTLAPTLILLVIATGWFIWNANHHQVTHDETTVVAPRAFATDLTVTQMDKNGIIHSIITTPEMHYQASGNTTLVTPHAIAYAKDGKKWLLDAKHGLIYDHGNKIRLWDQVKAHLATTTTTMTTSMIIYNRKQDTVDTTKPVHFTRQGSVLNGIGMHADLKSETVKLLSQTRGIYLPES